MRWITVSDTVINMLKEYKKWQDAEAERLAGYWEDHGYVFTQENGKPMHPDSINGSCERLKRSTVCRTFIRTRSDIVTPPL